MGSLLQDVRYGLRVLRKNIGFTIVAVLTLAVGIGATVGTFTVVNSVLLRPFPFAEPEQLVRLYESNPQTPTFSLSGPNYLDWQAQSQSLASMGAWNGGQVALLEGGEPEQLAAARVTSSLFPMLRIEPQRGRAFTAEEDRPGASANVALISAGLWERRFGSDPSVLGRSLNLSGQSFTVIGIMPKDFAFPRNTDVWTPLEVNPENRGNHIYGVMGRLKPGVTPEQARTELTTIATRLAQAYPATNKDWGATVMTLTEWIIGPQLERTLLVMMGAVLFVLLIACANVANLLLAKATTRHRELAIRAALGAGRTRLVRQLLTESVLLGLAGGGAGVLLAYWALDVMRKLAPANLPRFNSATIDPLVLAFAVGVCFLSAVTFGLAPALHWRPRDINSDLSEGTRAGASAGRGRLRSVFAAAEVALALVLLVAAGLMVRSFSRLLQVDPGFQTENVLMAQVALNPSRFPAEKRTAIFTEVLERVGHLPGVEAAGITNISPLTGGSTNVPFSIEGRPPQGEGEFIAADWRSVSPGFFSTMNIPLIKGRLITAADAAPAPGVAVINETMAKRWWPNEDPIGRSIRAQGSQTTTEIVGVVGDIKDVQLAGPPNPAMYLSYQQVAWPNMTLLVRTSAQPEAIAAALRAQVWAVENTIPIPAIGSVTDAVDLARTQPRFTMALFTGFSVIALLLAAIGIYGVVAFSVTQRTREIGIRMALGATAGDIRRLVLRGGALLALIGLAAGLAGAFALTRLMRTFLYEVSPTDPATFIAVAAGMAVIALLATYIPARRATRVDPLVALRYE